MSLELQHTLSVVLIFALPGIVGGLLILIVKKPLKRLITRAVDASFSAGERSAPTTFSFSVGSAPPANLASKGTAGARRTAAKSAKSVKSPRREPRGGTRPMDAELRARYLEEWRRIRARFEREPARALREAERLVTELMQKLGTSSAALQRSTAGAAAGGAHNDGLLAAVGELAAQIRDTRATKRAMQLAKSSTSVAAEDLRPAIQTYGRVVEQLLRADPAARPPSAN